MSLLKSMPEDATIGDLLKNFETKFVKFMKNPATISFEGKTSARKSGETKLSAKQHNHSEILVEGRCEHEIKSGEFKGWYCNDTVSQDKWCKAHIPKAPVTDAHKCSGKTGKGGECTRNGKHSHNEMFYCETHYKHLTEEPAEKKQKKGTAPKVPPKMAVDLDEEVEENAVESEEEVPVVKKKVVKPVTTPTKSSSDSSGSSEGHKPFKVCEYASMCTKKQEKHFAGCNKKSLRKFIRHNGGEAFDKKTPMDKLVKVAMKIVENYEESD